MTFAGIGGVTFQGQIYPSSFSLATTATLTIGSLSLSTALSFEGSSSVGMTLAVTSSSSLGAHCTKGFTLITALLLR